MVKRKGSRCTAWILMVVPASFFLLLFLITSCGEPSFCTLENISIAKKGESDENSLLFSVSGTDEDVRKLETGPGLLLCYVFLDSDYLITMDTSGVESAFNSTFNSISSKKMVFDSDNSILSFSLESKTIKLYAFQKSLEGQRIGSPDYCLNLWPFVSGTTVNSGTLKLNKTVREYTITDSSDNLLSTFYSAEIPEEMASIHVFAAITAEQGNFSNNYWSKLVYLGCMSLET